MSESPTKLRQQRTEKMYRQDLNDMLNELKVLVPGLVSTSYVNKKHILDQTVKYIVFIQQQRLQKKSFKDIKQMAIRE